MSDLERVMLSDYLLLQCISKGGVADVYRARQVPESVTGSMSAVSGEGRGSGGEGGGDDEKRFDVAVKVFRPGYAQRETFRDYFMIEAEKIGLFDHPHILPFLEYGEGEDLLYLVTPFVESGNLEDLLKRVGGRFSAIQALPIVQQLCSAMQYAHDHDVLHGNIKPSNIFVTADGRMLLSDFGIAHGYDDSQQSLTRVGWGSAEYAAPEQSLGVLRRGSDIYSLGVVLFRVLTGSTPFTGQTPVEVLLKHVRQQPPSARSLVPNISDAVDAVLRKALEKRSDDRFASASEFANAFTRAVTVAPVASPVARSVTTIKLQSLQSPSVTNPLTPPLFTAPLGGDPHTPNPSYGAPNESLPAAAPLTQEFSPSPADISFSSSQMPALSVEPPDSEVTEIRKKSFLEEDIKDDKHLFWSVDPAEWSPIAKDVQPNDSPAVPITANEYLQSKPVMLASTDSVEIEKSDEDKTFNARLKKWLPWLVVVLLLLGLLGALLSAFFYPASKPGGYSVGAFSQGIMVVGGIYVRGWLHKVGHHEFLGAHIKLVGVNPRLSSERKT